MTSAQIKELGKRIAGVVTAARPVRQSFATDASVLSLQPAAVAYPRHTQDVQAVVGYAHQQAKAGSGFAITARGSGTDLSGAAIGDGLTVAFPAHLNRLLRLRKNTVVVQPGLNYGTLQKILLTHERFLPCYPASLNYSTIGGAVANNAAGSKSLKYGPTRDWVKSLKVVLADGSQIETRRLSRRELHRKKGLSSLEGQIYRGIDGLLQDNSALVRDSLPNLSRSAAGYGLDQVRGRGGSFDLTPLFVGSQGTLGLVTEITLRISPFARRSALVAVGFDSVESAAAAVLRLVKLRPSAIELVDRAAIQLLRDHQPHCIDCLPAKNLPQVLLLIEFDNASHLVQNILARRSISAINKLAAWHKVALSTAEQEEWWRLRRYAAALGAGEGLPVIDDGVVPVEKLGELIEGIYKLQSKHKLQGGVWGHAGDGNLHMQPQLDLSKAAERKKLLKLMEDYYALVASLGGSSSAQYGDGLMRAPFLEKVSGPAMLEVLDRVKEICDPHGIFNPRVKAKSKTKDLEPLLRRDYSLGHLYDYLPHT